jgi:hypothetical protein
MARLTRLTGEQVSEIFKSLAAQLDMTPEELEEDLCRPACWDPHRYTTDDVLTGRHLDDLTPEQREHIATCSDCGLDYHLIHDPF